MTFDELLSILRGWTGRTVTMFDSLATNGDVLDDPITGTLVEGYAPAVLARKRREPIYEPTDDYAQFGIWREPPVEDSLWPYGKACNLHRSHASAHWDKGREGRALWIAIADGHTSLWVVADD